MMGGEGKDVGVEEKLEKEKMGGWRKEEEEEV
jgi:hypothetical protein